MTKLFEDLRRQMPAPQQERARKRTDAMLAGIALAGLRRSRGVTQDQLAKLLHVRQAAVSKLEGRDDLLLSTLAAYVRALGGTLEVVARFSDHAIRLVPRAATAKVRRGSSPSALNRGRKPAKAKRPS
jgi:transcriptional regulator with XRE-family HTH domain